MFGEFGGKALRVFDDVAAEVNASVEALDASIEALEDDVSSFFADLFPTDEDVREAKRFAAGVSVGVAFLALALQGWTVMLPCAVVLMLGALLVKYAAAIAYLLTLLG